MLLWKRFVRVSLKGHVEPYPNLFIQMSPLDHRILWPHGSMDWYDASGKEKEIRNSYE